MSLRFEAWTPPTAAVFAKILDDIPVADGSGTVELSTYADETISVPIDVTVPAGSLIAAFDGATLIDEFILERSHRSVDGEGQPTKQLSGPQVNGLLARLAVYPFDYPVMPSLLRDWIWQGKNLIPPLTLADMGNINAEWLLYLDRERYGLHDITATGGTYTLTANGDTTGAIAFDASAGAIKTELEALTGITEVFVQKYEDDSYTIVFYNPAVLGADMTINTGGLTGGTATLDKLQDGFDATLNPTFTITVVTPAGSDTTDAIPYNASAASVSNHLEFDLNNVQDVTVSGVGTFGDPWLLVFYDPSAVDDVQITFTAGAEVVEETQAGIPDPSPITKSERFDRRIAPDEHGTYGVPPIEVVDSPLNTGSEWTLLVRARSRFAGSQIRLNANPGGLYQASLSVRPTVTGEYRLVVRDAAENLIAGVNITLTAGVYTLITLSDIHIPAGTSQIAFRIGVIDTDPATWADFYVDWQHATFYEGMQPATDGEIMRLLLEACQARGAGLWLDPDFSDTVDSLAVAWPTTRAFRAFPSQNLAHVANNLHQLGGNWEIRRKATPVGAFTHDLKLYAPDSHPDLTTGAVAVLTPPGGSVVDRLPDATVRLALGDGGLWAEHIDTAAVTAFGRWEKPYDAEHLLSEAVLIDYLASLAADEQINRAALQVTLYQNDQSVPLRHFRPGDIVPWLLSPILAPVERPVQTISWAQGDNASYEVTGSRVFNEEAGLARAVEMLLDEVGPRYRPILPAPVATGGGLAPTIVFSTVDSSPDAQARADYVFAEVDANFAFFNEALARVAGFDARFLWTEGEFNFGANYPTIPSNTRIRFEGSGINASFLQWDDIAEDFLILEGSAHFDHITIRQVPGT